MSDDFMSQSSFEQTEAQPHFSEVKGLARRYSIHLGLIAVAILVVISTRFDQLWERVNIDLPSTQPQVVLAAVSAPGDGEVPVLDLGGALIPTVVPETTVNRLAIPHTYEPELPTHNFVQHYVEKGDTPNKVAELYGLEPATLLWGNPDLSDEAQLLQVGITLTILPTNGVLHTVSPSDTLQLIAELYGVEPQVIIGYDDNHLEKWPHRPVPDTQVFVPGGERQFLVWTYTPNSPRAQATTSSYYDGPVINAGLGRFIWPTDSWRLTQYYWWAHRAIDIGAVTGTNIYASDSGTVVYAGWSTVGYGNHVVIDHGNGFQTLYAHMSAIYVAAGQFVIQGTPIGAVGSTGNSSGPHLHFEIRYGNNLLNPLDYLWAQ